jgi:hypothetical protein
MARNITVAESGPPPWNTADKAASAQALAGYVEDRAKAAADWYWRNKSAKARLSRSIQFLAVALAAAAGLVPIVAHLRGIEHPHALWPSLLVGLAAALVGLDRSFGFSSGWARYVLAATNIQKALEEFRLDWASLLAKTSTAPSNEQILALVGRARQLMVVVQELVLQETKDWMTEFQNNIAKLEKDLSTQMTALQTQVQRAQDAEKPGALEVVIVNAAKADDAKVQIQLDNQAGRLADELVMGSKSWVHLNLPPGTYRLLAKATSSGKPISVASAVSIKAGEVAKPELSLPI